MKAIMNTYFALCLTYLSYGQYYESTLFDYSASVKQEYESRYDSLPYRIALDNYFNDPQNHYKKNDCSPYPDYFFYLTKVEFFLKQGKYSDALKLLDMYFSHNSIKSPDYINDYLQALVYKITAQSKLGDSKRALQTIQQADSLLILYPKYILKRVVYTIRNSKAILLLNDDRYKEVESILHPILQAPPSSSKADIMAYTTAMILMGEVQLKMEKADSALHYFNQSYLNLQQLYPPDHSEYVNLYIQFANYYRTIGQFSESENYFQKAKTIFKIKIGEDHPDYANILRMLANLYRRTGRFDLADNYYNDALLILKKLDFENYTQYAIALTNQGLLYTLIGKRKDAEQNFISAKRIMEYNADTTDIDYVCTLENLGNLYYNQLKLEDAKLLYSKTLQIRSIIQGEQHIDYAECLNSLANIYQKNGDYVLAESLYEQAIQIASVKTCGNNKVCPHFYNNLALLYSKTNQLAKAESLFIEVKATYENNYGKLNRTYLSLLENIAELYSRIKNPTEATKYLIEASKLRKHLIFDSFKYLSSNEVEGFLKRFQRGIANFNNYLVQSNQISDSLLKEAYENELFYKGFLMNYHLELNNIIETKPQLAYLNDRIKTIYKSIAKEYATVPSAIASIDSLEEIAHKLEKQLGHNIESYKDLIRKISYDDLTKTLKPNEAIVEIMYLNLNAVPGNDSIQYAAMLIPYGKKVPIFVNLCTEEELKKMFLKTNTLNADYVNTLYSMNSRGLTPIERNKNCLYDLIWKKIEIYLKGIQTIYYTPAGLLQNINIQAIPISKGVVTGEKYTIIQLTSSRQLLNIHKKHSSLHSALIMGGIQYDEVQNIIHYDDKIEAKARGNLNVNSKLDGKYYWPELNHTFREIYQLNDLFQKNNIRVQKYIGTDASEENFKQEILNPASPDIIHIATHGYFFPESTKKNDPFNKEDKCPFTNSDNPMMRSGLVLAFGNYAWQHCQSIPGHKEDGILTAFEISQMNLHKTKLAVLSACETGLGDIKGTEGVYGLQRAFKIAGVKYLVMSLWQIPDYQTEELMLLFYSNLLKYKMEIPKAFKKAQMDMKNKYNDPYFWAGFVLVQ